MKSKNYTRRNYEVHTSEDGEKWYRSSSHDDTPQGLDLAEEAAKQMRRSHRFVRTCESVREVRIIEEFENTTLLSKEQIADLLAKGSAICKEIKGLSCHEGYLVGFGTGGTMEHGPTRVTISFNAVALIGKCPSGPTISKEAKKKWNDEAAKLQMAALEDCDTRLCAAGIRFVRRTHEIELKV